jgi:putative selenate reductase
LTFGVKLSNTLAMANHRGYLPGDEVYMSGRALYPVTMNLFHKLAREFGGELNVSYSAGADALNVTTILTTGARPVTVASDLLKPGGYSRLTQYVEQLDAEMRAQGANSLDALSHDKLANLEQAARDALRNPRYAKSYHRGPPKAPSGLDLFDCITAPCREQCAVLQDVPAYAWWISKGQYDRALETILARNPLPGVTGHICTHLCQTRCTRNDYDEPVAIRALKRFATEYGRVPVPVIPGTERRVAIVGSGPSGLAAAYYLALNGVRVTLYEAKDVPGGMLSLAPSFRLPPQVVHEDIARILALGVDLKLSYPVTIPPEELLKRGFDAAYLAYGFQRDVVLGIEGIEGEGVYAALDFLGRVARGERPDLGERALVIGGGNTAVDAARTAHRLTGKPAIIVYRRSRAEMPAQREEVEELLAEGNVLRELVSPIQVVLSEGRAAALACLMNELGEPDASGRRRPIPVEGSEFQIEADSVITAIGQQPDIAFLDGSGVSLHHDGAIQVDSETGSAGSSGVYAGGDAARGPAIVIEACADGRRAAAAICAQLGVPFRSPRLGPIALSQDEMIELKRVRARKEIRWGPAMLPLAQRTGFGLVEGSLTEAQARREASRCMQCASLCDKCVEVCPNRANYVYPVEPVRLSLPQLACRDGELAVVGEELFRIDQPRQIVHIADFCNECGNCATFCVHQGRPYADKPRLYLREADFGLEDDNAFYIQGNTIRRREGGHESRLSHREETLIYESVQVRLSLSPGFGIEELELRGTFTGALSLRGAAQMAAILRGVGGSLPFVFVAL